MEHQQKQMTKDEAWQSYRDTWLNGGCYQKWHNEHVHRLSFDTMRYCYENMRAYMREYGFQWDL